MDLNVCPWYIGFFLDNPIRRMIHPPERMLAEFVGPGMTAADIGCGMGTFSRGMARLVGDGGRVLAVDLQAEMLDRAAKRAEKEGVGGRLTCVKADREHLGLTAWNNTVDFALSFWMAHEVPDMEGLFAQIRDALAPDGGLLLVEPRMHVSQAVFDETLEMLGRLGMREVSRPRIRLSRAAYFRK